MRKMFCHRYNVPRDPICYFYTIAVLWFMEKKQEVKYQ
jgi:hypothetical protein